MFKPASICLLSLLIAGTSPAGERRTRELIAGPVEAELVDVIDGDTLVANARPWPQHQISVLVRVRGIDAPEMKSRCSRNEAVLAKAELSRLLTPRLTLTNISGDKYFGRIVADVGSDRAENVGGALLATGLVAPYDGGRKHRDSC